MHDLAGNPSISPPCFCIASDYIPCHRDLSIYVRSKLVVGGLTLLVDGGCSCHMVDPATIPNAEPHLHQYQELRPPQTVDGGGSHELLSTGTVMLMLGVDNTDSKQREVTMSVLLVPVLVIICCRRPQRQQTGWRP